MKKTMKLAIGMTTAVHVGFTLFLLGAALPLSWELYEGNFRRAAEIVNAGHDIYGLNSHMAVGIERVALRAANMALNLSGSDKEIRIKKG